MVKKQDLEVTIRLWRTVTVSQLPLLLVSIGFAYFAVKYVTNPAVVSVAKRDDRVVIPQVQQYKDHVDEMLSTTQEIMNNIATRSRNCAASQPKS